MLFTKFSLRLSGKFNLDEESDVTSICFLRNRPDLMFVAASESIHLMDRRQFNASIETLAFNQDEINQVTLNEKEEFLAACDDSGEIKIINVASKRVFKTLRKHTNLCAAVTFRPKRPWDLLSGGYDQRLIQWDFSRHKAFCDINIAEVGVDPSKFDQYTVNPPFIHSMSLSAGGSLLACGTENHLIHVFNASKKTLSYMTALRAHTAGVSQVHFPAFDDYALLSGGNDGVINVWQLNSVAETYHCNGYSESPASSGTGSAAAGAGHQPAAESAVDDDVISVDNGDDAAGSGGPSAPRPWHGIQHGEKINWISTGVTSTRKYIVVADSSSVPTVYPYVEQ